MMNKWVLFLLLVICWACTGFLIFGGPEQTAPFVKASAERPLRIVSMAPNITEILFALGLDEEIVGVPFYSNYPPAAMTKPLIGTFWQPNIEAIIAANPDIVFAETFPQHRDAAARLQRMGCKCATVSIEKVPELFQAIEEIAHAVGRELQADELVANINADMKKLSDLLRDRKKPRVLWVVQREPLMVAGRDTFINEMIVLAGGENAMGPTINKYPPIGKELVIASSADVIIEASMRPEGLLLQQQTARQYWSGLNISAANNNRIYVIDGDKVSRLGPRLYEGIETIARCLWPELFSETVP
ncbi:MAG: hypothetical protein E4H40_02565 [Candidatus Brocadiia bacterium]|nr:MAG: hypothetical protein E4H40_02565 [Candidatus Brocadiia bacterium]